MGEKTVKKVSYHSMKKMVQGRVKTALRAEIDSYNGTAASMKKVLKWFHDAEEMDIDTEPFMKAFLKKRPAKAA